MTITLNGTTGITNDGGYTGDGVVFADSTPSNTLVTTTGGNVGIGTASPATKLVVKGTHVGGQGLINIIADSGTQFAALSFTNNVTQKGILFHDNTNNLLNLYGAAGQGLAFTTNDSEQARITTAGLMQFNSGYGSVATAYGCRAWVNFNGTGTVAIRASGNVSSITDNGTGDYTVNFTNAMPDANYSANVTGNVLSGAGNTSGWLSAELLSGASSLYRTSSAFRLLTTGLNGSSQDGLSVNLSIFR